MFLSSSIIMYLYIQTHTLCTCILYDHVGLVSGELTTVRNVFVFLELFSLVRVLPLIAIGSVSPASSTFTAAVNGCEGGKGEGGREWGGERGREGRRGREREGVSAL